MFTMSLKGFLIGILFFSFVSASPALAWELSLEVTTEDGSKIILKITRAQWDALRVKAERQNCSGSLRVEINGIRFSVASSNICRRGTDPSFGYLKKIHNPDSSVTIRGPYYIWAGKTLPIYDRSMHSTYFWQEALDKLCRRYGYQWYVNTIPPHNLKEIQIRSWAQFDYGGEFSHPVDNGPLYMVTIIDWVNCSHQRR